MNVKSKPHDAVDALRPLTAPILEEPMMASAVASKFLINYLCKAYHLFEGDLLMCIVFSEIALGNVGRIMGPLSSQRGKTPAQWQAFIKKIQQEKIISCNALSVSEATGIPRETVRRKVKKLENMGWLLRDGVEKLVVTHKAIDLLHDFSLDTLHELLRASREVQGLIETFKNLADRSPDRQGPGR